MKPIGQDDGWWDEDVPLLPRLCPGEQVGEFVIDGFLREGSWSDLYRAHHCARKLGPIALKVMPAGLGTPPPLADLSGIPHLVDLFGSGSVPERRLVWLAMRLVGGDSLDRLLMAGGAGSADLRRHLVQRCAEVASALAAMHARGFLHCDVKPANILVESNGEASLAGSAVLVDLDFARPAGTPSPASTVFATLPYAAPEQLLGLEIDGRADVFSLGLCMHDLLAGRPPERRQRRPAAGMEPLEQLAPDVGADLAAIVAEAVAPEPDRRYPGTTEFAADLRCWLTGREPSVRPRRFWGRALRCWRREPATFWRRTTHVLLLLAVVIGLAAAGSSWLRHQRMCASMEQSLAAGDLAMALQMGGRLGGIWPALGLDSPLDRAMARDPDLAAVVAQLRADHADAARRLAAATLARDGLGHHLELDVWLLWQAQHGGSEGHRAAALLSQALFDRPASPPDVVPPAICEGLLRLLHTADDDRALHALAALGGAAGTADMGRILAAVQERAADHSARMELVRLAIEVLNRIAARSLPADARKADCTAVETAFQGTASWIAAQDDRERWRGSMQTGISSWLLTIARLRARSGQPPPDLAAMNLPWPPNLADLAVAHDRKGFAAACAAGPRTDAFEFGFATAVLTDGAATEPAPDPRWEEAAWPAWREAFDTGARAGRCALSFGPDLRFAIDAGAGLADTLAADEPVQPIAVAREPARTGTFASWSLLPEVPTVSGAATAMSGRMVQRGIDEVEAGSHFFRLGCGDRSTLRLEFNEPDGQRGPLTLVLSAQKGKRGALPYCGEAGLDVLLDGMSLETVWDLGTATAREVTVPLGRMEIGRVRRLEIRLQSQANTTVRLFSARIE
jgi:serine/threonine protein kinase